MRPLSTDGIYHTSNFQKLSLTCNALLVTKKYLYHSTIKEGMIHQYSRGYLCILPYLIVRGNIEKSNVPHHLVRR